MIIRFTINTPFWGVIGLTGKIGSVIVGGGSSGDLSGRHFSGLIRQNAGIIIGESSISRLFQGIRGSIVAGKKTKQA